MLINSVSVKEKDGVIKVSFVHSGSLQYDIQRVFKSTRVNKHMFKELNRYSFEIYSFFALELYYVIDILLNDGSRLYSSKRTLKFIKKELLENTWLKNLEENKSSRLNYNQLNKFHLTPLDYQDEFMKRYDYTLPRYNLNGMMLAADPGTGKTFTSLAIAECRESEVILVVCPKPAVERVWVTSAAGLSTAGGVYKKPQTCWFKDSGKPYKGEHVAIFHYEALPYAFSIIDQFKNKKVTIILDESHNLNEIKSLRTLRFIDLCKELKSNDIIFATGTPLKALSVETIPLFKAIDPLFTDDVLESFKKMYSGEVQGITEILSRRYNIVSHKVSKKVINLREPIHEKIEISIPNGNDYTLETVAKEMAEFTKKRIKELSAEFPEASRFFYEKLEECKAKLNRNQLEAYNEYTSCLRLIIKAYNNGSLYPVAQEMKYCSQYEKNVLIPMIQNKGDKDKFIYSKTLVKYLKLKVQGECLGRILSRKRINAYKDLIKHINFESFIESTEKKTVIFTTYTEVVEETLKVLKYQQYNPLAVYGQYTKDLADIVHKFDKIEEINPLVATYASLSTAVPLIMADTMVIINPPFRQYIMDQTIARIHRLGSTTQTRIFNIYLVTDEKPNICSRTIDIMAWSKDQVNAILGVTGGDDISEIDNIAMEDFDLLESNSTSSMQISNSLLNKW